MNCVCMHVSPIKVYHAVCWVTSAVISCIGLVALYHPSLLRFVILLLLS